MDKLYITGIAGLLGGNIAYLLNEQYDVYGVDLTRVSIPNAKMNTLDLMNFKLLEKDIAAIKPDILVHCAAAVNVDECEEKPEAAERINAELTGFLAHICSTYDIKMVYISTDAVFNGYKTGLYVEEDGIDPLNFYGRTKYMGEVEVLKSKKNIVFRTNIYGYNIRHKHSFGEWVLYSLLEGKELTMFHDVMFSPILVNDLAVVLHKALESDASGLFHVCGTGSISKLEFGYAMKDVFRIQEGTIRPVSVNDYEFKAKRSKNMGMDNSRICKLINSNIRTPAESILEFKRLYEMGYHQQIKGFSQS